MEKNNVVVVTNVTGTRFVIHKQKILSLRETTKDQEFAFAATKDAQAFADRVNGRALRGLKAIFAGAELSDEELLETEGADVAESLAAEAAAAEAAAAEAAAAEAAAAEAAAAEAAAAEAAQQLKEKTVPELKATCKELGLSGYSKLKEDELIDLIINTEQGE